MLRYVWLIPLFAIAEERVDLHAVNRIKAEAFRNSTVMTTAFYLTDVYGPRLTGSPALRKAADWSVTRMREFGLTNPRLESWGPFGKRWVNTNFAAHLRQPEYAPLIGMAAPWARSTNGPVSGEPVLAPLSAEADFEKFRGKLRGRIVMLAAPRKLHPQSAPLMSRFTAAELTNLAQSPEADGPGDRYDSGPRARFRNALNRFLAEEGVALIVTPAFKLMRGDMGTLVEGGTVFGSYAGSWKAGEPLAPPAAILATEHYNRIARLLEHKIPVTVEFDIKNEFDERAQDSFSVIAELPGRSKPDEVIMLGAHLDSMSYGTGATDNAAGCSVVLEAMRILRTLNLPLARTVRVALWTGEEQSSGSRPYVEQHFFNFESGTPRKDHTRLSGYFNLDMGTGKIRGVYLQGNDMMRPIFGAWLAPFVDLGVTTISIRNHWGSDEAPFDDAGLPGFQFIQDPVEYDTRTHHSNMDVYDRLQEADLKQAAAVLASVVYHAANRDEMLPRKARPVATPSVHGAPVSAARQ